MKEKYSRTGQNDFQAIELHVETLPYLLYTYKAASYDAQLMLTIIHSSPRFFKMNTGGP